MKKSLSLLLVTIFVSTMLAACSGSGSSSGSATPAPAPAPSEQSQASAAPAPEEKKDVTQEPFVIGVSQCHMNTPYRVQLKKELEAYWKEKDIKWELIFTDGQNDPAKQTSDVEGLIARGVDIILMMPVQQDTMVPAAKKVMDAGIPLVLVDRRISTDDYTTYVGGDNVFAGYTAGKYLAEKLNGKGKVAYVNGVLGASAYVDREKGFLDAIAEYPEMELIFNQAADQDREKGMKVTENLLQAHAEIDGIYYGGDSMLLGGMQAIEAQKRSEILIAGTDGMREVADMIKKGTVAVDVLYPTGAAEATDIVIKILNGESVEKDNWLECPVISAETIDVMYDRSF